MQQVYLGILCHSSLQILSSSVRLDGKRWWTAIFRSLQRCSIGFKSGLWLGHQEQSRSVVKPLLRYFSCVLRVIVLLEGKPSAQSEGPEHSGEGFRPGYPVLGRIHLSLDCNQSSCPCSWKHPHSMMLPPPCFTVGTVLDRWWAVPGFLHTYRLELRPKVLSWSHQTRESFRCFLGKLHAGFHVSCTEERLPSGHSAIKPRLVEGCSDGWLSTTFSHLPNASLELSHSDLWVLLLPLSPRLFSPDSSVWPDGQL